MVNSWNYGKGSAEGKEVFGRALTNFEQVHDTDFSDSGSECLRCFIETGCDESTAVGSTIYRYLPFSGIPLADQELAE